MDTGSATVDRTAVSVGIVGASLAGLRMVEALRRHGHRGPITVVGDEDLMPYNRPPLSKKVLTGEMDPDATALPVSAGEVAGVEWLLATRATGLDPTTGSVVLADGRRLRFDVVVIATGASARTMPASSTRGGQHTLRTLRDAEGLRASLDAGGDVVVIGAGLIGCEVASACVTRQQRVTVVANAAGIMERVLPPRASQHMEQLHAAAGVDLVFSATVTAITGEGGAGAVELGDGSVLGARTVVVAIGSVANTGWLADSGLDVLDGVLTDAWCRAVGGAGRVYAIGDVCRRTDGSGHVAREQHWSSAAEHAETVASHLLHGGDAQPPVVVPFFWSDQLGHTIQVVGRPADGDTVVESAGRTADSLVLEYSRAGTVVAAVAVDAPGRIAAVRRRLLAARRLEPVA